MAVLLAPDESTACTVGATSPSCMSAAVSAASRPDPSSTLVVGAVARAEAAWSPENLAATISHDLALSPQSFPLAAASSDTRIAGEQATCVGIRSQQLYPTQIWTTCVLASGIPAAYALPAASARLADIGPAVSFPSL